MRTARDAKAGGAAGSAQSKVLNASNDTAAPAAAQATNRAPVPTNARFTVECRKASGKWITFSRYASRGEADRACSLLRWAGAEARVVDGDDLVAGAI